MVLHEIIIGMNVVVACFWKNRAWPSQDASRRPSRERRLAPAVAAKPYSDSALAMHQPRVVDLIPVRVWSHDVADFARRVRLGTGLEALYGYMALGRRDRDVGASSRV